MTDTPKVKSVLGKRLARDIVEYQADMDPIGSKEWAESLKQAYAEEYCEKFRNAIVEKMRHGIQRVVDDEIILQAPDFTGCAKYVVKILRERFPGYKIELTKMQKRRSELVVLSACMWGINEDIP